MPNCQMRWCGGSGRLPRGKRGTGFDRTQFLETRKSAAAEPANRFNVEAMAQQARRAGGAGPVRSVQLFSGLEAHSALKATFGC